MGTRDLVAVAASGSPAGNCAIETAFRYCQNNKSKQLLVIHILETGLSKFGEIDHLADGSSKAEFTTYIIETAKKNAKQMLSKILNRARVGDVQINWYEVEGDPVAEITNIVSQQGVSLLFIGEGSKPISFFSPPKQTANKITKHCRCRVISVADDNS